MMSKGERDGPEVGEVVVSVPAGTLCVALPVILPGADGLVLTVADGEGDGGVVGEEAVPLIRSGCRYDPVIPEDRDVVMEIACVLDGEGKDTVAFIEPAPVRV